MTRKATEKVTTIGIDIGKNNFHLIGLDGCSGSTIGFCRELAVVALWVCAGTRQLPPRIIRKFDPARLALR